ncbi:hypothetical protein ACH40E_38875 [Streptomyces acidicola]|uniref:hypothetical protein n=1 Tax=Streptomyces acidicola TaxID=2596892 RepID=UPI0037A69F2F
MVVYYADVKFLEDCDPVLIERNAEEYRRMRDLLDSIEPSVRKAEQVQWESVARTSYEARLRDVRGLARGLYDGYDAAQSALLKYADAVSDAKPHLRDGKEAQERLDGVLSGEGFALTRAQQSAEPMRRWEDMRQTTGFLDWISELGVDRDAIREDAERYYAQAEAAFAQALNTERSAREACVAALKAATALIPDFRTTHKDAAALLSKVKALLAERAEAAANPLTGLPGSPWGKGSTLTGPDATVSALLQDLRTHAKGMPEVRSSWLTDAIGDKREWVLENQAAIKETAKVYGLPPDVVAAIAMQEVGGTPYAIDRQVEMSRVVAENVLSPLVPENLPGPLGGDRDNTSYGPMAVQIRRAAETLGYEPANLTTDQRDEIRGALEDPTQNLLIATKYMADLKAQSSFADVPPEQMTDAQKAELASRYNGGPYWQIPQARAYADAVEGHRERVLQDFS